MSYGINHQVGVKASPDEIYKHLTETTKLAQWWTTDTRGSGAKVGDTLEFWFSALCQKFYVKELKTGKRVAWRSPNVLLKLLAHMSMVENLDGLFNAHGNEEADDIVAMWMKKPLHV